MYCKAYVTRSSNTGESTKYVTWTSEMDLCLSKILCEQVKKGHKVDGSLKPAAYNAAIEALNEKLSLDLTKEHIKNRLKTWKKQFGILKEILAHKDFKWDDVRKMVAADNSVWNQYIKGHLDARYFRARVIENYDELCVIFGNDKPMSIDDDVENDINLAVNGDDVDSVTWPEVQTAEKPFKNMRWTEEMDQSLAKILVEKARNRYIVDNNIPREVYDAAVVILNEKFGPELTKDHIRNRLRTWKKQYKILKELLSHGGFKWDETRKMVIADDPVWMNYIKIHPDARQFRARVVENYDQLGIIFGDYNEVEGALDVSPLQSVSVKDQVENVIWTNEMDCFLSKTLVEQVRFGNKDEMENKLQPKAYVTALLAMNEKFHHDLTEDHVRNRLKTWKKQYDILKELLNQSGFEWDGKQKMVVANEFAWNNYTKGHPDARLFQGQSISYYDDLCVIFGRNDPPRSAPYGTGCNTDLIGDDEPGDSGDSFNHQNDNALGKGKYVFWTNEMDCCLIEQLVKQMKLGDKLEKSFEPIALSAALRVLIEKFRLDLTIDSIRNRLRTLRRQYRLLKELLSQGGFEWDEAHKMLVASDSEWNKCIKKNPDVMQLRARSIENFSKLQILFDNDQRSAYCSEPRFRNKENPSQNNDELLETQLQLANEAMSDDDTGDGIDGSSQQTRVRPSSSSDSKPPLKRARTNDVMLGIMRSIAVNIGRIADALKESKVCLDELFAMVQAIPEFDDDLIIDACEYLSLDEKRARMFMKLDERLRKLWLLKRLRGQSS